MKALSIRQPWAWLILNAGKDIENRDWRTGYRGRILIHAGRGMTRDEYLNGINTLAEAKLARPSITVTMPNPEDLQRGGIVGEVSIVNCVRASDSPWFFGEFGLVLKDPQPLPFRQFKGRLGFFEVADADQA